jgi:flagellar operon protein
MLDRIQGPASGDQLVVRNAPQGDATPNPFADFLADKLGADGIKLSAHAQARLRQSNVDLDAGTADRLKSAFDKAEQKGSKDSLVLLDDLAFVVSVKNKTVITAVDSNRAKESVFTNIDSVVIG